MKRSRRSESRSQGRPANGGLPWRLDLALRRFERERRPLAGIAADDRRNSFLRHLVASVRRASRLEAMSTNRIGEDRRDPDNKRFDPIRAAELYRRDGDLDEAFWLLFLSVQFGKHPRSGWRYTRRIYGRLGSGDRWDWLTTSGGPSEFRRWLGEHRAALEASDGGFGNHRKFESLDAFSHHGTGQTIEDYIRWVSPPRTHSELVELATARANGDTQETFDDLYQSMGAISRFGRTARFDYLCVVGRLGLARVEPGSVYLAGGTGPLRGARLLFGIDDGPSTLDGLLVELGQALRVGMEELEDALCNWQKRRK